MDALADGVVKLENYYDNNNLISIPIDKAKSIPQNAAAYYKKYEKKSRAEKHIKEQIAKAEEELAYLESVQISLSLAQTKSDFDEIRLELVGAKFPSSGGVARSAGVVSSKKNQRKSAPPGSAYARSASACKILPYTSIDTFDLYLGKNNTQNDYLSLKFAQNADIWLHVQKQPGSHVIIRTNGREVPPNVLETAARIAKEHSKAKDENKAIIDYCLAKYVKKPNGAKSGFVTYSNFSSIII